MSRSSRTIYVGNLPGDTRKHEVENLFYKYGRVVDVDLKLPPRPPGYAFVEFEDSRDAEDAIKGRDGSVFDGHRLRVEFAHSGGRGHSSHGGDRHGSHRGGGGGGGGGGSRRGVSKRTEFRVLVTNLPSSASWQDLKDHMRNAGDVCFAQVYRESNGTQGVVDFSNYEDMKNAIRKLDDTEFRNPFASSYIRVKEDRGRSPSRSRSYTRSRSRSRSRSVRGRSRSKSRSRSPARRSRSPAGRSRSPAPRSSPARRSRSLPRRSLSASRSPVRSRSNSPAKSVSRSRSRSASPHPVVAANNKKSPEARSRSPPSPSPKRDDNDKSPARSPSPVSDAS